MKTQKISIGYKTLTLQISRFFISDTDKQNSLTMAPHSPRMILPPLVRIQDLLALSTINLRSRWTVMTSFYPTPTPQNQTRWLLQTTWWIPLDIFDPSFSVHGLCQHYHTSFERCIWSMEKEKWSSQAVTRRMCSGENLLTQLIDRSAVIAKAKSCW